MLEFGIIKKDYFLFRTNLQGSVFMGEFERYFTEKGREQGMKQGMKQGRKEEKLENIKALMESLKVSAQEAMGLLKITPEEQQKLLPLL